MILIENSSISSDFRNLRNEIYVFSKDKNGILLPINKYIRNSFDLIENTIINQKYFFEKVNSSRNEFILEFSSNYINIELSFNDLTNYSNPEIFGGFKQYIISIESNNSDDYYFNIIINPINQTNKENSLKEANIVIKYYEKGKANIDYIINKDFRLEKNNNTKKHFDYSLIINNNYEFEKQSNDFNYSYYLRLIKNKSILFNEELNTIALISSNLSYINECDKIDQKLYYYLNNLENNEKYIALFFIKVENEEEEKFYSLIYEFIIEKEKENEKEAEKEEEKNTKNNSMIILIIIIVLIVVFFLFFIIWKKRRINSRNIEDQINDINLSSGINDDGLINNKELSDRKKSDGGYINVNI